MIIMSDDFKVRLKEYVKNGGKVLLTARNAWKDIDNNLVFGKRLPVDLEDLTGCIIEEHECLLDDQFSICSYNGIPGKGYVFEEMLKLAGGRELVSWKDNPFGDFAAAVVNTYGKGRSYYLGSSFDEDILSMLFDEILKD